MSDNFELEPLGADDLNNLNKYSEELLSLSGMWQTLKNIKRNQKIMIETNSGRNIVGNKDFFDEATGMLKILCSHKIPKETSLETENPVFEEVFLVRRIHMSKLEAVCTFPNVTK